jgi:hypothetical protein
MQSVAEPLQAPESCGAAAEGADATRRARTGEASREGRTALLPPGGAGEGPWIDVPKGTAPLATRLENDDWRGPTGTARHNWNALSAGLPGRVQQGTPPEPAGRAWSAGHDWSIPTADSDIARSFHRAPSQSRVLVCSNTTRGRARPGARGSGAAAMSGLPG